MDNLPYFSSSKLDLISLNLLDTGFEITMKNHCDGDIFDQALKPETMLKYISLTVIFLCYFVPCYIHLLHHYATGDLMLLLSSGIANECQSSLWNYKLSLTISSQPFQITTLTMLYLLENTYFVGKSMNI